MGIPIDVIKSRAEAWGAKEDFHIGGSDASGIVWAVGKDVKNVKVGDEVVVHCGMWEPDDPWVLSGKDPMFAPTQQIWGYESNWGSFAQYTKVQDHQCVPKPEHLTWEEAAAYMLVGATAYRMLHGWSPNVVGPGEPVPDLGRRRRPRLDGDPDRARGGRRPGRGRLRRQQERVLQEARRGRRDQSPQVRPLGQAPALVRRHRVRRSGSRARARSAPRSGRRSARRRTRRSSSSTRARPRCRPRASCARPAAWS